MELDKVMIIDRRAGKARSIIEAVDQLPMVIPNSENCWIEVLYHPVTNGIRLGFLYATEEAAKRISLTAPEKASNVKRTERGVEFDYNGQHYMANVGVDDE